MDEAGDGARAEAAVVMDGKRALRVAGIVANVTLRYRWKFGGSAQNRLVVAIVDKMRAEFEAIRAEEKTEREAAVRNATATEKDRIVALIRHNATAWRKRKTMAPTARNKARAAILEEIADAIEGPEPIAKPERIET